MSQVFQKLPNILILISDQDRATQHYPEGWEQKNLKAMTLLKQNGLTFRNGFCNTCMCSPSRSTLFTSSYPSQHGVNQTLSFGFRASVDQPTLSPSTPNVAKLLQTQYDTHFRGKWHLSKGGMVNVHPEKSLMSAEVAIFGFKGWQSPDAGENVAIENCGAGYANHDAAYIEQADQFLQQYQNSDTDKPFLLVVSLVNPHDVLTYPDTYIDAGYTEASDILFENGIQLPATVNEDLRANLKPLAQQLTPPALARNLGALPKPQDKKNYLNFYAHLQKHVDAQMYELLKRHFYDEQNNPTALGEETIIIRLADHGELGMTHGGLRQKAYNVYEETMRVPYIISNPILFEQGYETDELASLIDIVPTVAGIVNQIADQNGITGVDTPSWAKGKDLSAVVFDPASKHDIQDEILFIYNDTHAGQANAMPAPNRIRAVRTHTWKYAHYFHADGSYTDEYELYFIAGIHQTDTLSASGFAQEMQTIRQRVRKNGCQEALLEASIALMTRKHPYEVINWAYSDPDKNRWVRMLIEKWEGVCSAESIIQYLDNKRKEMTDLLQAKLPETYAHA